MKTRIFSHWISCLGLCLVIGSFIFNSSSALASKSVPERYCIESYSNGELVGCKERNGGCPLPHYRFCDFVYDQMEVPYACSCIR